MREQLTVNFKADLDADPSRLARFQVEQHDVVGEPVKPGQEDATSVGKKLRIGNAAFSQEQLLSAVGGDHTELQSLLFRKYD